MKTITKEEIESLYRKTGISESGKKTCKRLNTGTMSSGLSVQFKGARKMAKMKGTINK